MLLCCSASLRFKILFQIKMLKHKFPYCFNSAVTLLKLLTFNPKKEQSACVNRLTSVAGKISLKPTHYLKHNFKLVLDELHFCELEYHCSESESHYFQCLVHNSLGALLNTIRLLRNSR